ncbi:lytic transglycosylase domain-containing protein [Shouchella shacheensis]|uniref:lytic transglycosylase domain-containing protein n=1 Tax=Shouchella shacheensis TaxID=1649580 RepID=UPI00073FFB06|nr:transglycosylase SLT domain-containing protein [Shouchella shacheensis]
MKQRFLIGSLLTVAVIVLYISVENSALKHQIAQQEEERWQTYENLERDLMQTNLQTKDLESNYNSWVQSMDLAEELHEHSDGHFKKEWGLFLGELSQQKQIDPYLVYELLKVESGNEFNPKAVGPETEYGRAYGLAQFMTNTAPWIADLAGVEYKKEHLFNPLYSIQLSVQYLELLYEEYGNWDYALTAYHRGMGGLNEYVSEHGHARSDYATTIQQNAQMHSESSIVFAE